MKQRTKRMVCLLLAVVLVFSLTGCVGYQMNTVLNEDGTCGFTLRIAYEQSFIDALGGISADTMDPALLSGDFHLSTESVGNFTYYFFTREFTFSSYAELQSFLSNTSSFIAKLQESSVNPANYGGADSIFNAALFRDVTVNSGLFKATFNSEDTADMYAKHMGSKDFTSTTDTAGVTGKLQPYGATQGTASGNDSGVSDLNAYYQNDLGMRMDVYITFPSAPTASNGIIAGNVVAWDLASMPIDGTLIAEVGGNLLASDTEPPLLTIVNGAANKKYYNKPVSVMATDNLSLKTFTVNGESWGSSVLAADLEDGKYTFVATDSSGNSSSLSLILDTKKPSIKGAKNKKTYNKKVTLKFSDKNGIKKITVNGKKIKTCKKKQFTKNGKYTVKVTDNAGNTQKITFKIKK